ncbi:DUF1292 domain-containing protein [bacterium]|nr:DUF1292 domain-containing protein [bacterium]
MTEENNIVELTDENGTVTKCEVFDIFEYKEKTYALLDPITDSEEEAELIVLECIEEGEEFYFQNIEDEAEFNEVCDYVQSIEYDENEGFEE